MEVEQIKCNKEYMCKTLQISPLVLICSTSQIFWDTGMEDILLLLKC